MRSHKLLYYSKMRKTQPDSVFQMEEVVISKQSVYGRTGFVQKAAAVWKGQYASRYQTYHNQDGTDLGDFLACTYQTLLGRVIGLMEQMQRKGWDREEEDSSAKRRKSMMEMQVITIWVLILL